MVRSPQARVIRWPGLAVGRCGDTVLAVVIPVRICEGSGMTFPLPRMEAHVCQADSACVRPPRFQARLEAVNGTQPVRQNAEACAGHLTDMVQALTTWARGQHLTDGELTVLTIDPPSSGSCLLVPADHDRPETVALALAFSTIRLTE
jgi:hypothetical protein